MLQYLLSNPQLLIVFAFIAFSVLSVVAKKFREYTARQRAIADAKRLEIERLRTGRGGDADGEQYDTPEAMMTPEQIRMREIAARRQQQLDELRRRREGKPAQDATEVQIGPGMVIRIPGSAGPTVPGTRAPTPRPQTARQLGQQSARSNTAQPRTLDEQARNTRMAEQQTQVDERRDAAQRRVQAEENQRRQLQEAERKKREIASRQQAERRRQAEAERSRRANATPWESDADSGESTTRRMVSDARAAGAIGAAPAAARLAASASERAGGSGVGGKLTSADWRRAIMLREILAKPVADRDPTGDERAF